MSKGSNRTQDLLKVGRIVLERSLSPLSEQRRTWQPLLIEVPRPGRRDLKSLLLIRIQPLRIKGRRRAESLIRLSRNHVIQTRRQITSHLSSSNYWLQGQLGILSRTSQHGKRAREWLREYLMLRKITRSCLLCSVLTYLLKERAKEALSQQIENSTRPESTKARWIGHLWIQIETPNQSFQRNQLKQLSHHSHRWRSCMTSTDITKLAKRSRQRLHPQAKRSSQE